MVNRQAYKYNSFVDRSYSPKRTDVVCQYRINPTTGHSFEEGASRIAEESSVGNWTEIKTINKRIRKALTPRIFYLDKKNKRVRIAYPLQLFERGNLPGILSSVGGNIFGMKSIKELLWEDIQIPKKMLKSFKGPRYGIDGLRKRLRIKKRPLIGTVVKPKVGLQPGEHSRVAYDSWRGGCDLVKDDENLTSQKFSNFKERFLKTIKLCDKAEKETGERKAYLVNCTAETKKMLERIDFVEKHGGNYIMLDILTLGWGALQTAREYTKLPIHAHMTSSAMFERNPNQGMSMEVLAELARMVGVDTLHIGTPYGKRSENKINILHIEKEIENSYTKKTKDSLAQKWYRVKPVMGVASGGIYPGILPKIIGLLGKDIVLQAGGGIHGHPLGSVSGATAMRQAVTASMKGIPLDKYARNYEELNLALKQWGK
jgi:ribulose-bisphosphate carboxylase large chain